MPQMPPSEPGKICPLHKKDVSKVCHKCPWYIQLRGKNPQTGADMDDYGCAIAWMPLMQIETAQRANQTAAAVESFRNEMSKDNKMMLKAEAEKLRLVAQKSRLT